LPSMRCVGYRQAWEHLDGELSARELLDRSIFATRQLAKRQLTWIRATPGLHSFDCADPALTQKAAALITAHVGHNGTEG
jgi:tRNA dimethylallyltransferase